MMLHLLSRGKMAVFTPSRVIEMAWDHPVLRQLYGNPTLSPPAVCKNNPAAK